MIGFLLEINYSNMAVRFQHTSLIYLSIAGVFFLSFLGCSAPKQRIDPTVVSTSYDYTKPVDIAAQSKPVWVLPVINKGWIPARVDPKTGDWISGHYQATIVQEGYWATQEEAELSGRPYIVAGDSSPIIPKPTPNGPKVSMENGAELDIKALKKQVEDIQNKQASLPPASSANADQMAALSAQLQALAIDVPGGGQSMAVPSSQRMGQYKNAMQVEMGQPPPEGQPSQPMQPQVIQGNPRTPIIPIQPVSEANLVPQFKGASMILPSRPPGSTYELPTNTPQGNVSVRYISDTEVEVTYGGQTQRIRVSSPNDRIKVTLP